MASLNTGLSSFTAQYIHEMWELLSPIRPLYHLRGGEPLTLQSFIDMLLWLMITEKYDIKMSRKLDTQKETSDKRRYYYTVGNWVLSFRKQICL